MSLLISGDLRLRKEFQWNETVWNPSMISTALWLDATDSSTVTTVSGNVSEWRDKNQNGIIALQATSGSRPTYDSNQLNGKSVLGMTSSRFLTVGHRDSLNMQIASSTVIAVYKKSAGFRLMQKSSTNGASASAWFWDDANTLSVAGGFATSYATNQNQWLIDSSTWDGSTIKHWRNGSKLIPTTASGASIVGNEIDPTSTPTSNTDDLFIGRRQDGGGAMTGQIAVLLFCNQALSDSNRQKIEGYYAHSLALTANLPSDHPYKTVEPTP